ncbi:PKD domain-containing protein [Paenibacillus alba]|uniref:PKD domain-containing protein n=1 Tax=Paenibacillus alba TaxID=1197127 RepID=A0ABU6G8C2_9BACL|nr:PKD domain-containing protein [Paenibacillus alba]MEC0228999.1 PKD domain-containing protein [Paenibacillus alba]
MSNFINRAVLLLLLFEPIFPLFYSGEVQAASTVKLYYNFEKETYSTSFVSTQYSSSSSKDFEKDISSQLGGTITDVSLSNEGGFGGTVTFSASTVKIVGLSGGSIQVYGKSQTKPMHQIYRQPQGKIWEHNATKTPYPIEFDGVDDGSVKSPYPGKISSLGRKRYTNETFNYTNPILFGPDLRYTYQSSLYASNGASGDRVADYDKEGYAVTTAYSVDRPNKWFLLEGTANLSGTGADITDGDKLVQDTISIIKAEKPEADYGAEPLAYGKGDTSGQGMIRTMMLLNGSVPIEQIKDLPDPDGSGGLLRNYQMYANGIWQGTTYKYQMSIEVTYTPPVKPDLASISIDAGSCVAVNISTNVTIKFKNLGIDIPSGSAFHVTLAADGTVFKTFTYTSGVSSGQTITETIPYTFSGTKSLTLVVDSSDTISETSSSNNTLNQIITPQASCSPSGGNFSGTTRADKPSITWKESNIIRADWTIPSGCTPVRGRFVLSQSTGGYVQYGWSSLTAASTNDMSIFAYGMMGYLGYPGNMESGSVRIEYKLEDSCGGTSYFGTGTFTIGPKPPNRPPQFEIGWFPDADYYSRTPIPDAIVGDRLNVRLLPEVAPNHYDPDDDLVTFEWRFAESTSAWIKSFPSQGYLKGEDKLTWLTAPHSVGDHTITARMCDQLGACTQKDATIHIMRPEPIPCINVPSRVVQNRPLTANAINGACSKPAKNRTIEQEFWTNKRTVYPNVGFETITLEVSDNRGVRSLPENMAIKQINVVEDKAPVALINLPLVAVRGSVPFKDMSYSPDGDLIVSTTASYQYDSDNDGNFDEHSSVHIPLTVGGYTSLPAAVIGNYRITVKTTEDWGLTDTKPFFVSITNDSPEVSFTVTSANPEPPLFNTMNESEMLMAFGDQWQGSSLTNQSLDKVKNIGLTYNTVTKGFTSHYGKAPYNAPVTNLTFTPTTITLGKDAGHSYYVPQLFSTQYLGKRYGVASIGGIPVTILTADSGGGTINAYTGKPYSDPKVSYETGLNSVSTASNTGNYLSYDAKGGTYSLSCRYYYYNSSDDDVYRYWCDYTRKNASGNVSWVKSFEYGNSGVLNYMQLPAHAYQVGTSSIMEINEDGTKIKLPAVLFKPNVCWYCGGSDTSDWIDVETGVVVPTASIVRPPQASGAVFEDADVVITGHSDDANTYYNYNNTSNSSNYNMSNKGTMINYLISYNKHTGVTTRLDISSVPYDDAERYSGSNYLNGGEYTERKSLRDIRFTVSADGYVFIVDGLNKIVVTDKYAVKIAEYTTAGIRPVSTKSYSVLYEDYQFTIDGAGFGSDGEFYVIAHERHFKDRRYNIVRTSCGSCSAGSYISSYDDDYSGSYEKYYYYTIKGTVATNADYGANELGQIMKKDTNVTDADYYFDFLQTSPNYSIHTPSGMSFRAQNNNNMYRLEVISNRLSLSKIVNGVRTELRVSPIALNTTDFTNFKISVRGSKIKVRLGTTPIFDATDSTFTSGTYGAFIGGFGSQFRNVSVKIPIVDHTKISDRGIVGEELTYTTEFNDPEADAHLVVKDKWTYEHRDSTKFLDAEDGKSGISAFHNQTVTGSPVQILDKVGIYKMTLIGEDDPAPAGYAYPNPTFAMYQAESDPYARNVLIHRRPIAVLHVNQDIYYNVTYVDQSYDPDRWLPSGSCSTEPTGINYCSSRGIVDRRYEYILPDGTSVDGQIHRVKEMGMYTFRVAVKDEYGAWSDWAEAFIWLNAPLVNHAPFVQLTSPTGVDYDHPTGSASSNPLFTWNAVDYDAESVIKAYEMDVQLYLYDYYSTPQYRWVSYTYPNVARATHLKSDGVVVPMSETYYMTLNSDQVYKVRVRVQDEYGLWSDWDEKYFSSGSPPKAVLTYPSGTQANPTAIIGNSLIPAWVQTDVDTDTLFQNWQYRILDENGIQLKYTSGDGYFYDSLKSGSYEHGCSIDSDSGLKYRCSYYTRHTSWTAENPIPIASLPNDGKPMQVQVRVHDGKYWSDWSNTGWFLTNRPPSATMIVPSGTQGAPTLFSELKPTFGWHQNDPDPNTTFTYFQLQITNETNDVMVLDSGPLYQGTTSNSGSWAATQNLPAGEKLRVRARVFDGFIWSDYSPQTWFYINRAPIADFDWSPKPVWEGDRVQTTNSSYDPDGDALTYSWKIEQPNGNVRSFSDTNVTDRFLEPGNYRVTLTVSDGYVSSTAAKIISVLPLTIQSDVTYTANWHAIHEKSGHQTSAAPKDFYSGEIFMVSSRSSPAPVDEVTAWLDTVGLDGRSLYVSERLIVASGDATRFVGEIFDSKFQSFTEGLPQGLQTIHFRIRYHNGTVKTEDIPVHIIGNVNKSVGVHRVQ